VVCGNNDSFLPYEPTGRVRLPRLNGND
jgi:hypothetical protein